ncbi:Uncharacterised protein [Mycobacterium tuberculosis]|uniref:Uncharacterized protein n=1 Tax=Mycobacterium tuberculosis TaxID=1773 RepID=A0A916PCS2_MYCTX|nr:Uncharacterised protein [Mycobacterium tuberculosis]
MNVRAERTPTGGVQAGVIADIEGMLESTTDVPQIGWGTQQIAVSLQHLDRRNRQGGSSHHLDALNLGIGRAGHHRLKHLLHVRRRRVVHDQQAPHRRTLSLKVG